MSPSEFSKKAYAAGASAARSRLGLGAPPEHLPAERLAKTLTDLPVEFTGRPGMGGRVKNLERPVRWGAQASLESTNAPSHDYSGAGVYSGV